MANILSMKNVSLTYHSKETETLALENITFDMDEKSFYGIVGPSGCGKTTILSILSKLIPPSDGEISLKGIPLLDTENLTGLMPQSDQLFEWRNILRNVMLGLEIKRMKTKENIEIATNLLEKYGLKDFMKKRPSELSGGMRQRASLIRTLVTKPELLLLDEPFSALDYQTRLNVCNDVHAIIKAEGKSAILVTHDLSEAISICDKIVVLTNRPAVIKKIYEIDIDKTLSPLQRRDHPNFRNYFKFIWEDLEDKNERRT